MFPIGAYGALNLCGRVSSLDVRVRTYREVANYAPINPKYRLVCGDCRAVRREGFAAAARAAAMEAGRGEYCGRMDF